MYTVRQRCGQRLAIEHPTNADVVSTVPESATPAALGYAQQVSPPHVCSHFNIHLPNYGCYMLSFTLIPLS